MAPLALLSVSNKEGLVPLAKTLINEHNFEIISSGGTAKLLEKEGLQVTRIADYTNSPEILGGRVKTLHPRVHGGILANKNDPRHLFDLEKQNIKPIDLVVVNLYPFEETISDPKVEWDSCIEQIDIGGPAMIRAAAKNHANISILTSPNQYQSFLKELKEGKGFIDNGTRIKLALKAFEHTASYDIAISKWMKKKVKEESKWLASFPIKQTLRYGENPHQTAKWFGSEQEGWGAAKQLQGKELSTNNLLDLEAAISTVCEFGYGENGKNPVVKPAAVVIKHTNPCGVAINNSLSQALIKAIQGDQISAFGGIVAINGVANEEIAKTLTTLFLECVVAPRFDQGARDILSSKPNLRLLELSPKYIDKSSVNHIRSILGGLVVQTKDNQIVDPKEWKVVTEKAPTSIEIEDLTFAWKVVRHVHSNAIVVAKHGQSLGIGAGQMNRIGSAHLSLEAAGKESQGAVLASDGFFPFDDTVRLAAKNGIKAIIQPGGSIRDKDSISACNEFGISMISTGIRHFLH